MDNRDLKTLVTYVRHYHDKRGLRVDTSWGALFRQFSGPVRIDTRANRDRHGAWSPALFKGNFRLNKNVESISALVLDYDQGEFPFEAIREEWSSYFGFIHTTASHTAEKPRLRVILPFSRPVTSEEYVEIWDRVAGKSEGVDRVCSDPGRFWYMPTYVDQFEFAELTGELLNPDLFEPTIDLPKRATERE